MRAAPKGEVDRATLEAFLQLKESNPFDSHCVNTPDDSDVVNVPDVHRSEFDQIKFLIFESLRLHHSKGIVLWGEAGIGKSHLLGRLHAWSSTNKRALFAFLHNVQASPENMSAYVLKCVLSQLAAIHGDPATSRLYLLISGVVKRAIRSYGDERRVPSSEAKARYNKFVRSLSRDDHATYDDQSILSVLYSFFDTVYRSSGATDLERENLIQPIVRWLSGERIDAEQARLAGLPFGADLGGMDDQRRERVLLTLSEFARVCGQPFVICFDQVDNMEREQVAALTRFAHTLLDHSKNLVVITAGLHERLTDFAREKTIKTSSWDRVAQEQIQLQRIHKRGFDQVRELIAVRLEGFFNTRLEAAVHPEQTVRRIKELRSSDPLFPMGSDWWNEVIGDAVEVRPRDVINWARTRWRQLQFDSAEGAGDVDGASKLAPATSDEEKIDAVVGQKVDESWQQRINDPSSLPPDDDNLCALLVRVLQGYEDPGFRFARVERGSNGGNQVPTFDLLLEKTSDNGFPERIGIKFLVDGSAATALRKILESPVPLERQMVVADDRRPLRLGATGDQYLEDLKTKGRYFFCEFELPFVQYALLETLVSVEGAVGELEFESGGQPRTITRPELFESYRRQGFHAEISLLRELLEPVPDPPRAIGEIIRNEIRRKLKLDERISPHDAALVCIGRGVDHEYDQVIEWVGLIAEQMSKEGLVSISRTSDGVLIRRPGKA